MSWWGALVVALLTGAATGAMGALLAARGEQVYESTATLLIDQPNALAASGDELVLDKLTRLRLKYSALATTRVFTETVSRQLGLEETTVAESLFTEAPRDSLLLVVGARGGEADSAFRITRATAAAMVRHVRAEQDRYGVPRENGFRLSVVAAAQPARRVSPTATRVASVGLVAGVAGFALTYRALRRVIS